MTIPKEAIEAATAFLPGIPENSHEAFLMRTTARAALEAAMPHIREQIADEILAEVPVMGPQKSGKVYYAALMHAARIVTEES